MIHIIGTSHSLQVWTPARRAEPVDRPNSIRAFACYLGQVAAALKADVIAEEASPEWLDHHGPGASSVARGVASDLGIEHLFCDPDSDERRSLNLKTGGELVAHAVAVARTTGEEWTDVHNRELRGQFPVREAVWVERLQRGGCATRDVIFVCGADHTASLLSSLEDIGFPASVYCRDWTEL
jgi:hypothetical protein